VAPLGAEDNAPKKPSDFLRAAALQASQCAFINGSGRSGHKQIRMPRSRIEIYWKKVETAPESVIAQVRVTDGCGSDYLLPYACKLTKDGWVNAASGKPLAVRATYWKLYVETLARKKPAERKPPLPQADRD
jgi:hypothetical protein